MGVEYGEIFDPQIWLDSSNYEWLDKSRYSRHPTIQGGNLDFVAGPNSLPVVNANGQFWDIDLDWMENSAHSVYAVIKPITFNNLYGAAIGSFGRESLHVGWQSSSQYRVNHWGNNWNPFYNKGSNFVIVCWSWGDNGVKRVINNIELVGTVTQGSMPLKPRGGGRLLNVVGQGNMSCQLGEVLFFNKVHNSLVNSKIFKYLNYKWDIY